MNRARRIDREISQLLELQQHTRDRLTNITQTLTADVVSGSPDPHKFDKLAELESDINTKIDELVEVKRDIFHLIQQLPTRSHRLVLMSYYLDMRTWEQTAVNMNYSWRQTMRIHGQALIEVEKILQQQKMA